MSGDYVLYPKKLITSKRVSITNPPFFCCRHACLSKDNNLLNIALSSPLGVRVRSFVNRNMHYKGISAVDSNGYEDFCGSSPTKDAPPTTMQLRVRRSEEFPVTFRQKRGRNQHYHTYKFTASERREFGTTFDTGLNKHSRELKGLMRPCKVRLRRLSEKTVTAMCDLSKFKGKESENEDGLKRAVVWNRKKSRGRKRKRYLKKF